MTPRKTLFVSVNLTSGAREALRQAVLDLSASAGRRLSMSDVVIHATRVAMQHREELVSSLGKNA